jgi:phosphoglycolate phosphatase
MAGCSASPPASPIAGWRSSTHHGLRHRFVTLQTADRHPSKPHPSMIETAMAEAGASPETTAMIGDTSFDMAMARAAGAHAIGVAWGYHTIA